MALLEMLKSRLDLEVKKNIGSKVMSDQKFNLYSFTYSQSPFPQKHTTCKAHVYLKQLKLEKKLTKYTTHGVHRYSVTLSIN